MTRYWRDGAWMNCSHCAGYGMVTGYGGDPCDCWHCDGSGAERARDDKGRYTRFPTKLQEGGLITKEQAERIGRTIDLSGCVIPNQT